MTRQQDPYLTIRQAKAIVQATGSRLPRPGYEALVVRRERTVQMYVDAHGHEIVMGEPYPRPPHLAERTRTVVTYLVNEGGRFRVRSTVLP